MVYPPRLVKRIAVIVAVEAGPLDAQRVDSNLQALELVFVPLAARRALWTRDVMLFLAVIAKVETMLGA
jgi:hypothetical protein